MLSIGIVGLPNVGKSTLFNALTKSAQAEAQNYAFCTIEPNVGIVEVPDSRLDQLAEVSKSLKKVPTAIKFVDIAGLVKGAADGEGLGNKFLSHIREVDAIAHVVRNFSDANVTHVHGEVNVKNDAEIINYELIVADLQSIDRKIEKTGKKAKGIAAKELEFELNTLKKVKNELETGKNTREIELSEDENEIISEMRLLTSKPIMYIINMDEGKSDGFSEIEANVPHVPISAKLEAELVDLSDEETRSYMKELGMETTGLDQIVQTGYKLLDLVTFFTSGVQEARAWTITKETLAPDAAGTIHTDFVKGFIKADVCNWEKFVEKGGWNGAKEEGLVRLEGKQYVVQDGDVCLFHVNT